MALNYKNRGFSDFLAIFGCKRVNCDEMDGDRLKLHCTCEQKLV